MELIQSRETRRGMARQRPGRPAGGPGRGDCADGWDEEVAEPAIKPGSVVDSHSSGTCVTAGLKQPTRVRHEPCHSTPIWSCSGWGLPCHACCQTRGALLPHLFNLACAPGNPGVIGGVFSVALSVGLRPPGVTWHSSLRSPDFPLHQTRQHTSELSRNRHSDCLVNSLISLAQTAPQIASRARIEP